MATSTDARTIPFDWYSNPDVLRLERERIFRSAWQYAGRADQIAEPGSFFACDAGGVPVVVVRDKEGSLAAFVNVCRHRGSLVCEGEGRRETLQCPYHAWTYNLDGTLRTAPRAELEPGFDESQLGLVPVLVDVWGPFVFVNPDTGAPPLAEHLGELPELVAAAGPRPRLASIPQALDLGVRGELEGVLRELPRVLPLPDRSSGLLEGRRRLGGRVRARAERHLLDAVRPGARGMERRLRPSRPGRARPVPLPLAEYHDQRHARSAEPLDRPGRASRRRAHGPLPRLLRRSRTSTTRGSRTCSSSTTRSAPRTPSSSSACRKASAAAASSTAGCCSSPSACSRIFRTRSSLR